MNITEDVHNNNKEMTNRKKEIQPFKWNYPI